MEDDFFGELDKKLSAANDAKAAKEEKHSATEKFAKAKILEMHEVAKEYVAKLRERGIHTELSGGERGLKFEMHWADGGNHGLSVYPDLDTGRIKITKHSTDHTDGRRFRSTSGTTYDEDSWKPNLFQSSLESVINDYVFYANKHRGIA